MKVTRLILSHFFSFVSCCVILSHIKSFLSHNVSLIVLLSHIPSYCVVLQVTVCSCPLKVLTKSWSVRSQIRAVIRGQGGCLMSSRSTDLISLSVFDQDGLIMRSAVQRTELLTEEP